MPSKASKTSPGAISWDPGVTNTLVSRPAESYNRVIMGLQGRSIW